MARWFAVLLFHIALLWLPAAEASHFRYGTISWAPTNSSNTIRFTFRLAFRRSFSSSYNCDKNTISRGSLLGTGGSWRAKCNYNYCGISTTTIANTGFRCTDYSTSEDWSMGENNFTHTFSSYYNEWVVSYTSCCWISLTRYGNGNWLVSTTVNLTRRSDNGQINSSPVSRSPAIVRWHEGCPQSLRIPVEDADGDVVKCRLANYSESSIFKDSFPYGNLHEETCLLTYDGRNGTVGTYALALTLEDFPAGTTNFGSVSPFSAVGLQFLVKISSHSGSCNNVPVFTPSTPQDGKCTEVQTGSAYKTVIEVTLADFSKHIAEIVTSSPPGMQLTSLRYDGGVYYRNVTWYPSQYQVGQQSFCFKAVDSSGMGSEWRCVTILVGISSTPRVVWGSQSPQTPSRNRGLGYIWWSVQFDRVIKKPRVSSYIRLVLLPSGHTVHKVDTRSQYVIINSDHTTLQFAMPYAALSMNGSYAILMDRGAVVGQGCSYDGPPTPGITNTSGWQFPAGVCPVGFTLAPPNFSICVDINECGTPSRSKRSSNYWWWNYIMSSSTQLHTYAIAPTASSSFLPYTASSFPGNEVVGLNNSVIVGNNSEYLANLTDWLKPVMQNGTYWKLCWRATRDGWSATTFHSLCDEKGPTITIIKVGKYVFGGFTSLPWPNSTYYHFGYDANAFLFSLVNRPGWAPVKLNQSDSYSRRMAITSFSSYGPIFGGGYDIYIASDAAYSSNSYSNLGYTYPLSGYNYGSSFAQSFLAGSYKFKPDEIETFFYKTFTPEELVGLSNSVILGNSLEYVANLTNWIKPVRSENDWKLCWRATRDGWDGSRFHSLCDEKGPTVTIVRAGKYIFGGYTSLSWPSSSCSSRYDPQAFLFSLVNSPGWAPVKFNQSGQYSHKKDSVYSCYIYYYYSSNTLPSFGGGSDLAINPPYASSYSNLGHTYGPPRNYSYGSSFARTFLAGSSSFIPDEVETFYDKTFVPLGASVPSSTTQPPPTPSVTTARPTQAITPTKSSTNIPSSSISFSECSNHTYLEDYRRAQGFYNGYNSYVRCDNNLPLGWYRFRGAAGTQMPSSCIGENRCGAHGTGWLSTQHPSASDGIVNGTVCFHWSHCCLWSTNIRVRNCSGFYVYELRPTASCNYRYCGNGEAVSYSVSTSKGIKASQISAASSSGYYVPSSSYVLPAPVDFQFHLPADCDQICTNTQGSYKCSCVRGYRLSSDGKSCLDIDECSTNNGGCSHRCYNIPGSFYCGCPEGTTMASNNLTCVEPGVSVACDENNMTISLEKQTFPFFNVSTLHLRYSSCRATQNSTHLIISTPLNACGTLVNETEDALIFWNEVRADAVIIDNVITRTHDIKLKFYCSYSRKKMLSIQFKPKQIFIGSEAGYGNFTFKMDFYKTAAYATRYTANDYPIPVKLNEYFYVKYSVESSADLVIMAETCKATKYGNFYSWPQYSIIQNGCKRDTTMEYTYNPSGSSQQFKLRAFRFFNDYDVVYFHCELLACYRYSSNSRCSRSCLSSKRRKRRGTVEEEIKHEESTSRHILSSGPIKITDTEKREKGDTGQSQKAALIGGAAAGGGFALIAIIALAVLAVKYRLARRLINRNKVGDLYTTQDEQLSRRNAYIQEDDMIEKEDSF